MGSCQDGAGLPWLVGEKDPPAQIILQPTCPECRGSPALHKDLMGSTLNMQNSVPLLQRCSFRGLGERSSISAF